MSSADETTPGAVVVANLTASDLVALRRHAEHAAIAVGLDNKRADQFALAVSEIAANAIEHGRPPSTATVTTGIDRVIVEITDCGRGFRLPYPSPQRPDPAKGRGRGLWLARQWADLEIANDRDHFTIRLSAASPIADARLATFLP